MKGRVFEPPPLLLCLEAKGIKLGKEKENLVREGNLRESIHMLGRVRLEKVWLG